MKRVSITGRTTLIGLGIGFILFRYSVYCLVASLFIGIGVGLIIEYILSKKSNIT
ncbi:MULTISPECIES: hypothetical protein [unclassified Thermotoga]|uniref:hypothetical protein n=1 Tax=unclassified Thermotoga TaxID=2631113 RepID=UPI000280E782|nr:MULTISPECIES: hypothetical protein [unclassified Thermotoga]AIY87024.1 multidrug resistance protein [Thermotoga sp. 2812B]EJX25741.1 multidrug resistance protein [Thermotoga sp. EMP]